MARLTFEPAAVLRKVVEMWRARKVGSPLPPLLTSAGRYSSQSAMYSGRLIGRPATEGGAWELPGSGSGKMVETVPVVDRARRRRAISVEVNQDGARIVSLSPIWMTSLFWASSSADIDETDWS